VEDTQRFEHHGFKRGEHQGPQWVHLAGELSKRAVNNTPQQNTPNSDIEFGVFVLVQVFCAFF
jgi:hypothetical protein